MSISQTYRLAHSARAKLAREAKKPDHSLRLLVGHANLLDNLMMDLAEAERDQEAWFNQSVQTATKKQEPARRVQWADSVVVEEPQADWQAEDAGASDSDSEYDEEDYEDEDADLAELALQRTPSHSYAPPTPELELDEDCSDCSSDDDTPPSPPTIKLPAFSEKHARDQMNKDAFYDEGYYLPPRDHSAGLISAISVY